MLSQKFYSKVASNKWWEKYQGEDNVLIEDMDTTHAYQGYNLKIWADKYAFPVEIKFAADLIRPKIIIVTSNYSIKDVFPDPSIHLPLLERFKVIHKTQRWNATVNSELMPVEDSFEEEKAPNNATQAKKKSFITKPLKKKFRKYDKPLKKPALYRQNADGDIVPNHQKQPLMEESLALKEAQMIATEEDHEPIVIEDSDDDIIAKEKEIMEIENTNPYNEDYMPGDLCIECDEPIFNCFCYEKDDDIDIYNEEDSDYFPDDECSEDLFDI